MNIWSLKMRRFKGTPHILGVFALVAGPVLHSGAQVSPGMVSLQAGGVTDIRHGQSTPSMPNLQAAPEDLSKIPMRAGYLLNVQVFNAPDLSGVYSVDSGGSLTLPLIGKVNVADLTLTQTQTKIADALKVKGYILDPSVSITVQQYVPSYVTVLGEVQNPGRFQMLASHPIKDVLAMAGGSTLLASGAVEIERTNGGVKQTIEKRIQHGQNADLATTQATEDEEISPGDEILVKRAGVVYVLGGVTRPGGYVMQEDGGLNVVQAVALASGTTMQASVGSMRVVRRDSNGSIEEFALNYKRMVSGDAPMFVLRPQDVVYVPISKTKAILTGGAASVLGAATSAAIYVVH
jgi:polysaccharide export outer membrane protein